MPEHISLKEAIKLMLFDKSEIIINSKRHGVCGDSLIPFVEANINGKLYNIDLSKV